MKLTSCLALAAFTGLPLASGRNCSNNLLYCGYRLLGIGNYQSAIDEAMRRSPFPGDGMNVIFQCGPGGTIQAITDCTSPPLRNVCYDGGPGKDDYCDAPSSFSDVVEQRRLSMLSSAKMRIPEEIKEGRGNGKSENAVGAALEVLEKALHEKKAKSDVFKDPVEALVIVAMALEM